MNICIYKSKKFRQKHNLLTAEQTSELANLVGLKLMKNVPNPGLTPTHLFRLRKRKLEMIYDYLKKHKLIHDKEPVIESLQTHQLGEYLLNTIYPGFPASKAKILAYTDYRECREKEVGQLNPLAYDFVPTTEVFDRLDEIYRLDIDWNEHKNIELPISAVKKSIERIRFANHEKSLDNIEYHLYLWNSTRTLLKPHCKSLKLNEEEIWTEKHEKMIQEGFMHIDITETLKLALDRKLSSQTTKKKTSTDPPQINYLRLLRFEIELADDEESNISHVSICTVLKKSTQELIADLYLQSTTECITKVIRKSQHPLDTQHIIIHLLKQYHQHDSADARLKNAETIYMTCKSNTTFPSLQSDQQISSSEEEEEDQEEEMMISLVGSNGKRLEHPVQSVHCKHRSCFEASVFFDGFLNTKMWHCPICNVHIKGFEELRIDYSMKVALNEYTNEDKLFLFKNTLISETEFIGETSRIINVILDEEDQEVILCDNRKRSRHSDKPAKRYRITTHVN